MEGGANDCVGRFFNPGPEEKPDPAMFADGGLENGTNTGWDRIEIAPKAFFDMLETRTVLEPKPETMDQNLGGRERGGSHGLS